MFLEVSRDVEANELVNDLRWLEPHGKPREAQRSSRFGTFSVLAYRFIIMIRFFSKSFSLSPFRVIWVGPVGCLETTKKYKELTVLSIESSARRSFNLPLSFPSPIFALLSLGLVSFLSIHSNSTHQVIIITRHPN